MRFKSRSVCAGVEILNAELTRSLVIRVAFRRSELDDLFKRLWCVCDIIVFSHNKRTQFIHYFSFRNNSFSKKIVTQNFEFLVKSLNVFSDFSLYLTSKFELQGLKTC